MYPWKKINKTGNWNKFRKNPIQNDIKRKLEQSYWKTCIKMQQKLKWTQSPLKVVDLEKSQSSLLAVKWPSGPPGLVLVVTLDSTRGSGPYEFFRHFPSYHLITYANWRGIKTHFHCLPANNFWQSICSLVSQVL